MLPPTSRIPLLRATPMSIEHASNPPHFPTLMLKNWYAPMPAQRRASDTRHTDSSATSGTPLRPYSCRNLARRSGSVAARGCSSDSIGSAEQASSSAPACSTVKPPFASSRSGIGPFSLPLGNRPEPTATLPPHPPPPPHTPPCLPH